MLYRYNFIKEHKMITLNKQFLFFIRKIRNVAPGTPFDTTLFFHNSFLNVEGRISPNNRVTPALEVAFQSFFETFRELTANAKSSLYKLIIFSQDIHDYFETDTVDVRPLKRDNLRAIVGNDTFENLMISLWNSLKSNAWEIDSHYETFFNGLETKTCAFCGINQLPNPESYRADYDHLAYKGLYPISTINLKNISPSCSECNTKFKLQKDIFYEDDQNTRRVSNYPYLNFINVQIDLAGSILPQTQIGNPTGTWNLQFTPDNAYVRTWEYLYDIKRRYIVEVLAVDYNTWLGNFKKELRQYNIHIDSVDEIKNHFLNHYNRYNEDRLQKRYIVKSALFRYFNECNNIVFYNQIISEINAN